ncbi:MAG: hypothetical protein K6F33_08650 [Bacteroidales bacterium]|nr:hypothetical protein [Bacteroidales bacterium]
MLCCTHLRAQSEVDDYNTALERAETMSRINTLTGDLKQIYVAIQMMPSGRKVAYVKAPVAKAMSDRLKVADRALKRLDFQWNTFYQTMQLIMIDDESLMEAATNFKQAEQNVRDSLDKQLAQVSLLIEFCKAEAYMPSREQKYKDMFDKSLKYSLVSKLAPLLEKVKGEEQIEFAEIQKYYDKAKEATEAMPGLRQRMTEIDKHYIILKDTSAKIQASEYKPLIDRVKDYLLGFAAVAILLMFANALVGKIQAIKKTRESMKQMKEMMGGGKDTFYPTI